VHSVHAFIVFGPPGAVTIFDLEHPGVPKKTKFY
jgi:hypothetical protein